MKNLAISFIIIIMCNITDANASVWLNDDVEWIGRTFNGQPTGDGRLRILKNGKQLLNCKAKMDDGKIMGNILCIESAKENYGESYEYKFDNNELIRIKDGKSIQVNNYYFKRASEASMQKFSPDNSSIQCTKDEIIKLIDRGYSKSEINEICNKDSEKSTDVQSTKSYSVDSPDCQSEEISELINSFPDKISRASSGSNIGSLDSTYDLHMAIAQGKMILSKIYANPDCKADAERLEGRIKGAWAIYINLDYRRKSQSNKMHNATCSLLCNTSECSAKCDESYEKSMKEVEREKAMEENEKDSFFRNLYR